MGAPQAQFGVPAVILKPSQRFAEQTRFGLGDDFADRTVRGRCGDDIEQPGARLERTVVQGELSSEQLKAGAHRENRGTAVDGAKKTGLSGEDLGGQGLRGIFTAPEKIDIE